MADCEEIQVGKFRPMVPPGKGIAYVGNDVAVEVDAGSTTWHIVWLPRQDQIQEMLGLESYGKFYAFTGDRPFPKTAYYIEFDSWEKSWLAFYMHEKHSKIWDGEKWIKK